MCQGDSQPEASQDVVAIDRMSDPVPRRDRMAPNP